MLDHKPCLILCIGNIDSRYRTTNLICKYTVNKDFMPEYKWLYVVSKLFSHYDAINKMDAGILYYALY